MTECPLDCFSACVGNGVQSLSLLSDSGNRVCADIPYRPQLTLSGDTELVTAVCPYGSPDLSLKRSKVGSYISHKRQVSDVVNGARPL